MGKHADTAPDQVVQRWAGASIVILDKVPLTAAALEQLPGLRLVAVAATGTDCVDKLACQHCSVLVSNIRGHAVNTVPEPTFALMLALRRNLVAWRQDVIAGRWQASGRFCFFDHPIRDLAGARLGIIGEGVGLEDITRIVMPTGAAFRPASRPVIEAPGNAVTLAPG